MPTVTMRAPSGQTPSSVHLPDGTTVVPTVVGTPPNLQWQVEIQSRFIGVLTAAGWTVVV